MHNACIAYLLGLAFGVGVLLLFVYGATKALTNEEVSWKERIIGRRPVLVVAMALAIVIGLAMVVLLAEPSSEWSAEDRAGFEAVCLSGAVEPVIGNAAGGYYCGCMVSEFEARDLSAQAVRAMGPTDPEVLDVSDSCRPFDQDPLDPSDFPTSEELQEREGD